MKKRIRFAAILACMLLSGCAGDALPNAAAAVPEAVNAPAPETRLPEQGTDAAAEGPLAYVFTSVETDGGSFFIYPKLLDESKTAINATIEAAVSKQLKELGAPCHAVCEVAYSGAGFFSVKSSAKLLEKEPAGAEAGVPFPDSVLPLTFDTASCRQICIGDLFDPENERWRGLIPDIVTLQAQKRDMTLLCDVMPAADDRLFYLTEDSLVILYRPYEIATYSAGWPEFPIPLTQLSGMLLQESPIAEMAAANSAAENETETEHEKEGAAP